MKKFEICAVFAVLAVGLGCGNDDNSSSSGSGASWTVVQEVDELTILDDPVDFLTISLDGAEGGSVTVVVADEVGEVLLQPSNCTLTADAPSCVVSASAPLLTSTAASPNAPAPTTPAANEAACRGRSGTWVPDTQICLSPERVHAINVWTDPSSVSPTPNWKGELKVNDTGDPRELAKISIINSRPCLPDPFNTGVTNFRPVSAGGMGGNTCGFLRDRCPNSDWIDITCKASPTAVVETQHCAAGESELLTRDQYCTYNWPDTPGVDYGVPVPNFRCNQVGQAEEFQYVLNSPPSRPGTVNNPGWAPVGELGPPQGACQPYYEPCDGGDLTGVDLNCVVAADLGGAPVLGVDLTWSGTPISNSGGLAGWTQGDFSNLFIVQNELASDLVVCPSDTRPFEGDTDYSCVCATNGNVDPVSDADRPQISFQVPWIESVEFQTCLGQ